MASLSLLQILLLRPKQAHKRTTKTLYKVLVFKYENTLRRVGAQRKVRLLPGRADEVAS